MFSRAITSIAALLCVVISLHDSKAEEMTNVALGKPTYHRSTYNFAESHFAVDGLASTAIQTSCTHTAHSSDNFWVVDLLSIYQIHSIRITNTNTDFFWQRLTDFYIYVSDLNPLPIPSPDGGLVGKLCAAYPGTLPPEGPHTLTCQDNTAGRYVYVWKPTDFLTICEFQVMVENVKLDAKKASFHILQDTRSSQSPFYSTNVVTSSRIECVRACMSAPGGYATIAQMDTSSNACECVQESELGSAISDVLTSGWIMMKSSGN